MRHATFKQGPFEFATVNNEGVVAFTVEDRGHTTSCHVWQRATGYLTYGTYGSLGKRPLRMAHRVAYESVHGPIPKGLVIDHLCRVPACVNPDHLEAVTQARNIRRSIATKLTDRKATEIRRLYQETDSSMDTLAAKFGVSFATVRKVLQGETWRGVDAYTRGTTSKRTKLTDVRVAEMRALWATGTYTQEALGKLFGVNRSRVSVLVRGKER